MAAITVTPFFEKPRVHPMHFITLKIIYCVFTQDLRYEKEFYQVFSLFKFKISAILFE